MDTDLESLYCPGLPISTRSEPTSYLFGLDTDDIPSEFGCKASLASTTTILDGLALFYRVQPRLPTDSPRTESRLKFIFPDNDGQGVERH
jgi:hypothetical protein